MSKLFTAKPYIIAEVGSNWRTLEDCLTSIRVAKECGADAVKFQAFNYQALYGMPPPVKFFDRPSAAMPGSYLEELEHALRLSWLPNLHLAATREGIDFGCTAFSPELVAAVDPYVNWHKVASSDAAWPQLLEAVRATGKPVLLSTGAKTGSDIDAAHRILGDQMTLLLCCAEYPADFVDLTWLKAWKGAGFSDHTLGFTATVEAVKYGATVIEKHFTAFPDMVTPDREHSLDPTQFKRMVSLIWRLNPDYVAPLYEDGREQIMHLRANRRLVATTSLPPGTILRYGENYGAYRALHDDHRGGASPFDWEKVEGKALNTMIGQGAVITLEDVE